MRLHTRLGLSVCLTVFSLVSIILLLPTSRVSTQLQKIALGTSIDNYRLWNWGLSDDAIEDGIRIVVFGDSWADNTIEDGEDGKGRSWTEVLCDEIYCSSYLNFGTSQPSKSFPASPPTGAITANNIYLTSLSTPSQIDASASSLLPDLSAQIEEFIALPEPNPKPTETIFIISFGTWDVYHFAGLDLALGKNITDSSITEIFAQLDTLYLHQMKDLPAQHSTTSAPSDAPGNSTDKTTSSFRVIIPKLFDPSLLPGWLSQRPVPLRPSSIAEQQKNAMYLTTFWNGVLETKIGNWLREDTATAAAPASNDSAEINASSQDTKKLTKDIFYYDLPRYLLNIIVEHQLEDEGLSDASGLGKGDSPFDSVYQPCIRVAEDGAEDGYVDLNGQLVCKEPEEYLFWDSFNLGAVANEGIGKEVGEMVRTGKSMRKIWEEGNPKA